ncbi:MAG: DinB family protein [Anaerolineaceae bacterium]|nr:DinB family protein [Anaerolineaceae bacterium]
MHNEIEDLLRAYRATPEILQGLLAGRTPEQLAARGGDEGWTVAEVICHLRDAEERGLQRTRAMREQDNPTILSYDQEQLARDGNYAAAKLEDALAAFLSFRQAHVRELEDLSAEGWMRTGQHNEVGQITIRSQIAHLTAHDAVHLAQIARQIGG